eukprot:15335170-Ditylum_brightwellii.AAC.1
MYGSRTIYNSQEVTNNSGATILSAYVHGTSAVINYSCEAEKYNRKQWAIHFNSERKRFPPGSTVLFNDSTYIDDAIWTIAVAKIAVSIR